MSAAPIDAGRSRRLAWLAIAVYIAALGIASVVRVQGDFNVYYHAGARILHGEPVYRLNEANHFLYAPLFAIVLAPLAALPLRVAQFLWFVVNAAGLAAFIRGTERMLFEDEARVHGALIAVPVILAARLIGNNFEHGQANLPVLALVVWSIVFAEQGREAQSGLLLAAALLVKPFAVLAALFLGLEGRWRALAYLAGFALAMFAAPVLFLGLAGTVGQTRDYARVVLSMTGRYTLMLTNQSATSAAARILSLDAAAGQAPSRAALYIGMGFEALIASAISVWCWRASTPDEEAQAARRYPLAAFFCLMPSLAPVSWKSYYAALLVPYMAIVAALWARRSAKRGGVSPAVWTLLVISAALNWVPGGQLNRVALFYSAHFVSSMVLLAALAVAAAGRCGEVPVVNSSLALAARE